MSVDAVLDTNVLLYAASKAPADHAKAEIALHLVGALNFGVPLQVLQEFLHNSRVKARLAIEADWLRQYYNRIYPLQTQAVAIP